MHSVMLRRSKLLKRDPKDNTKPDAPVSYFELANAGIALDEAGGRFSAASRVVGSTPDAGSVYPAASTAQSDPVPLEEPLGESVDDMVPVGTPAEVEASLARIDRERETEAKR
jgi:hypothetical protein